MSNDIKSYGTLKKEVIDKLKGDIEDILDNRISDEDEKLDVLKQISNLEIRLDAISEEDDNFDKSENTSERIEIRGNLSIYLKK